MTAGPKQWNSTLPARSKPLPRNGKPLKRSAIKKKRGPPKRFAKLRLPYFKAWVKEQPCAVTGLRTGAMTCVPVHGWIKVYVDPAHVRARSLGGADAANIIPLVRHLHDELDHRLKRRLFEEKYNVDLGALAQATWERYLRENPKAA